MKKMNENENVIDDDLSIDGESESGRKDVSEDSKGVTEDNKRVLRSRKGVDYKQLHRYGSQLYQERKHGE